MSILKYRIITSPDQYDQYCKKIDKLVSRHRDIFEEIALLSLLVEKYKDPFNDMDPVEVLLSLMEKQNLKQADIVRSLKLSAGVISDIVHYRKGFSKNLTRQLSKLFNISQEVFNKPYKLGKKKKLKKRMVSLECPISEAV